jgi:multiple sugar transport system substrate-binding protein
MIDRHDDLVRELAERNVSRREILKIGARLGLSMTALSAILAEADLASVEAAGNGPGWPKTNVPEPKSPVTITVSHAWEASFWPRQVAFDRAFMKRHPNIKVKAENTPFPSYLTKYLTQAAGGSLPDVMYCQYAWIQQFIKVGTFIPLDSYIAKQPDFKLADFTKPSLYAYRKNGQLYAIPYDTGPIILYYNKDIFDKARVPYPAANWTLDHMKQAAKELTHGKGPSKVFGFGGVPNPVADLGPVYLYPFGAKYVNEPQETKCLIDQPPAVVAMEWWYDFQKKGLVPSPAEVQAMAGADPFIFGKVAMTSGGSWNTPNYNQNAKFKWDVQFWPRGPKAHTTSAEGSGYAITNSSKNKDAAWIYLNEYLSTAGQIFMWASTGRGSPARNSAWPAYLHSKYAPKHASVVLESLNTFARPDVMISPVGPKVVTAARSVWDLVIAGKMAVPQALKQICSTIDPLLAQNAS